MCAIFSITPFDSKCKQNLQMPLSHFYASSYRFKYMKILNVTEFLLRMRVVNTTRTLNNGFNYEKNKHNSERSTLIQTNIYSRSNEKQNKFAVIVIVGHHKYYRICHRMEPLRLLCSITLIYICKVKHFRP